MKLPIDDTRMEALENAQSNLMKKAYKLTELCTGKADERYLQSLELAMILDSIFKEPQAKYVPWMPEDIPHIIQLFKIEFLILLIGFLIQTCTIWFTSFKTFSQIQQWNGIKHLLC